MEKDGIKEKLRRAKAHRRQSEVLFCIFIVGLIFTDILLKSNHIGTRTGIAIFVPFWALGVAGVMAILHYDNLVKKYNKQLEESPKKKNKLLRMELKSLDLRLAKEEITKKKYEEMKKALEK